MLPGMSDKVHMLGWFMTAGAAASFLFEIPSGYISDLFGHKKTLLLSKVLMIICTFLYIFADHWIFFLLAAIASSAAWAFQSGTLSAIVHNTMGALGRENEFTKYFSKVSANISLISALLLVAVPFFTEINILIPFYIALALDFVGLAAVWFITEPSTVHKNSETNHKEQLKNKSIKTIFLESKNLNFLPYIFFSSFLGAIGYAVVSFKEVYLISINFPLAFVGFVSGLSRLTWFFTGHFAHIVEEKVTFKQLQKYKLISTSTLYIMAGYISNPYLIVIIFALDVGVWRGLSSINSRYFMNHYVKDKKYKATVISMQNQFESILTIIFSLAAGYLFAYSYSFGFMFAGVFAFIGGVIIWQFLKKTLK
jgi:MFS family permease